jgi:hypothetical protein
MSIFEPEALERSVKKTLAQSVEIPDDAHGAFFTAFTADSIKAGVAFRTLDGDGWDVKLTGEVGYRWGAKKPDLGIFINGTF